MNAFVRRLCATTFPKYLIASVIALVADLGCFLLLLDAGLMAVVASSVAYAFGIVVHWLLSSRTVFAVGVAERGPARTKQKALFVMSALVGLALTTAIVGTVDMAGADPRLAKIIAVGVSFVATWLLRQKVVFRQVTA